MGAQEKQLYQGISFIQILSLGASDARGTKGLLYKMDVGGDGWC